MSYDFFFFSFLIPRYLLVYRLVRDFDTYLSSFNHLSYTIIACDLSHCVKLKVEVLSYYDNYSSDVSSIISLSHWQKS